MLRVIFFGFERCILEELRNCSVVAGVYVPPPRVSRWKLRDRLLGNYYTRVLLRLLLKKETLFFRKWMRTLDAYTLMDYAHKHRMRVLSAPSVNDLELLQTISHLRPDLGVVANFGQIIRKSLLEAPRYGFINLHTSLLPKYRGPTPIGHIMLNGETRSGATWHRMVEKADSGDILAQEEFPVGIYDTQMDLAKKSLALGRKMLKQALLAIESGTGQPTPQNEAEATCYTHLTLAEQVLLREIDRTRLRMRKTL